jgi:hypothetical protein
MAVFFRPYPAVEDERAIERLSFWAEAVSTAPPEEDGP